MLSLNLRKYIITNKRSATAMFSQYIITMFSQQTIDGKLLLVLF